MVPRKLVAAWFGVELGFHSVLVEPDPTGRHRVILADLIADRDHRPGGFHF